MKNKHKYKIKVIVTYNMYIITKAENSDKAIDELEKQIDEMDNYMIVNRSDGPYLDIESIEEIKNEPKRNSKKGKRKIQ